MLPEVNRWASSRYGRAVHLNAIAEGKILERLNEKDFENAMNSHTISQYRKIIKNIGEPNIRDFAKIIYREASDNTQELPIITEAGAA